MNRTYFEYSVNIYFNYLYFFSKICFKRGWGELGNIYEGGIIEFLKLHKIEYNKFFVQFFSIKFF